jgi:hypothetical protein
MLGAHDALRLSKDADFRASVSDSDLECIAAHARDALIGIVRQFAAEEAREADGLLGDGPFASSTPNSFPFSFLFFFLNPYLAF